MKTPEEKNWINAEYIVYAQTWEDERLSLQKLVVECQQEMKVKDARIKELEQALLEKDLEIGHWQRL